MFKDKIKTGVWSAIGGAVITMIIGFSWGGWVLGSTSRDTSNKMAETAVVDRLTPICLAQFNQDPEKATKLVAFKETKSWDRAKYVKDQGWATMPFETEPDTLVANKCSVQIFDNNR